MAQRSKHFESLDSWRGICALMVVLFHFPLGGILAKMSLIEHSNLFVDFFFVLSGFVIAANYMDRVGDMSKVYRFAWLRIGRLYPLHLAVLLAYLAFELLEAAANIAMTGALGDAFIGPKSEWALPTNFLLIQAWGMHSDLTWNEPSWSISAEMGAYLLFALVTCFTKSMRWIAYAAIIAVSFVALYILNDRQFLATADFGLLRCFAGFFTGVFVWRLWRAIDRMELADRLPTTAWSGLEAAMVVGVITFVSLGAMELLTFFAPAVFGLTVLVFGFDRGVIATFLRRRTFVFIGALSYSIYMTHVFLVDRLANFSNVMEALTGIGLIGENARGEMIFESAYIPSVLLAAMFLVVVIVVSWITYRFIEVPARDWFRDHAPRKAATARAFSS